MSVADLARVQCRREWPTRVIQAIVNVLQDRLIKAALDPNVSFTPLPGFLRQQVTTATMPKVGEHS